MNGKTIPQAVCALKSISNIGYILGEPQEKRRDEEGRQGKERERTYASARNGLKLVR